jgi:hypothetical protein
MMSNAHGTDVQAPLSYPSEGFVSCSEEHFMLTELCQSLFASCNCVNDPPNAMDETRQEAKLLMNLLLSNVSSIDEDEICVSAGDTTLSSDRSLTSSEHSITSKRDMFTFTCPSLSLENPASNLHILDSLAHEASELKAETSMPPLPAHLLGRPLKLDDRDALRLSADAMARNVLQSFQKAMHYRISAWIHILSQRLVEEEQCMLHSGASVEDTKALLKTPEAALVMSLQKLLQDRGVSTESASTYFEVLLQRIEDTADVPPPSPPESEELSPMQSWITPIATLSSRSDSPTQDSYSYTVAHHLRFSCSVQLQTLAGFTEIALSVPGSITGSFESACGEECIDPLSPTTELKSVTMDLDTNILASMIEKACRTIVRSSVEKILSTSAEKEEKESEESCVLQNVPQEENEEAATQLEAQESAFTISSPPGHGVARGDSVFVTPRCFSQGRHGNTPSQVLLPMPDDLDRKTDSPRRISPQPMSSNNYNDDVSLTRFASGSLKRRTPPPISIDEINMTHMNSSSMYASIEEDYKRQRHLPLISPPAGYQEFHEVPENGPSLPLLVAVACRAIGATHGR